MNRAKLQNWMLVFLWYLPGTDQKKTPGILQRKNPGHPGALDIPGVNWGLF
jgi:hypothetical protein